MQCELSPLHTRQPYRFVVILSFCGGQLVLSRHKQRITYETQGGHIEPGETPEQAARRELWEESGAGRIRSGSPVRLLGRRRTRLGYRAGIRGRCAAL